MNYVIVAKKLNWVLKARSKKEVKSKIKSLKNIGLKSKIFKIG